jgi:RNA polymerase sigma-70 factor (ECF subfamily)
MQLRQMRKGAREPDGEAVGRWRAPAIAEVAATQAERATLDPTSFEAVYLAYVDRIYRYCYARLRNREAAEDATSDTFLKALAALGDYRGGALSAWLLAIARNAATDQQRGRQHIAEGETADLVADDGPGPEEQLLGLSERRELRAAVDALPEDQRMAIELQLAGWSLVECAEAMGRSVAAVKTLRVRAVARLRRNYADRTNGGRR